MATSDNAIGQARSNADLTEVATSGPWVVFEVADSDVVTPLANQPAVVDGIDDSQLHWVEEPLDESGRFGGPATSWFVDPEQWDVPLASSGPGDWQRVDVGERPDAEPLEEVEVSDVVVDDDGISFDVDQVGVPVLVKMSYFPNWSVRGADGPYRVAPNFMVVVPNDTHVELSYGRTGVEWLAYGLTLLGVVGLVLLVRRPLVRFPDEAGTAVRGDGGVAGAYAGGERATTDHRGGYADGDAYAHDDGDDDGAAEDRDDGAADAFADGDGDVAGARAGAGDDADEAADAEGDAGDDAEDRR
jgi:hypothetical protein